ncbi:V-type ATPase [Basidiobolus meristosporus CBS 931.73]|uniref:V-type proton ATPase subunit G n=1 Tax=Basidiobolus meristosporus CBS 931.73 TaxID=1314790 RepID=A0A1Y1XT22_9FUNG|nr:V-type ATPase [Basidiobolus meristosporus CBS 931.73]|eukprot:ORX88902.1 V-type ATPase [Basidiobolus meristosporus CBS 931.73]
MSASNSQGIQTLLEAEKEASRIVQQAKQYRVQRLKEARSEAAKEIEAIKAEKAEEFKVLEQQHLGTSDQGSQAVLKETQENIKLVEVAFEQNKEKVLAKLLETVTNVKPKIHVNARS